MTSVSPSVTATVGSSGAFPHSSSVIASDVQAKSSTGTGTSTTNRALLPQTPPMANGIVVHDDTIQGTINDTSSILDPSSSSSTTHTQLDHDPGDLSSSRVERGEIAAPATPPPAPASIPPSTPRQEENEEHGGGAFSKHRSPPPLLSPSTPSKRTSSGHIKFNIPLSPDPGGHYVNGTGIGIEPTLDQTAIFNVGRRLP
jgi:hypothetical protein